MIATAWALGTLAYCAGQPCGRPFAAVFALLAVASVPVLVLA